MTIFRCEVIMLCSGEPWRLDNGGNESPTNFEIVSAFSLSPALTVHCIINTAGNELFVAASSCRNAKIIAVYKGHLEAVACGKCSRREADEFLDCASDKFRKIVESLSGDGEPRSLWPSGYISAEGRRATKERMEKLMMGRSD